jgi:uncharacterized protein (UPF0335 family)
MADSLACVHNLNSEYISSIETEKDKLSNNEKSIFKKSNSTGLKINQDSKQVPKERL